MEGGRNRGADWEKQPSTCRSSRAKRHGERQTKERLSFKKTLVFVGTIIAPIVAVAVSFRACQVTRDNNERVETLEKNLAVSERIATLLMDPPTADLLLTDALFEVDDKGKWNNEERWNRVRAHLVFASIQLKPRKLDSTKNQFQKARTALFAFHLAHALERKQKHNVFERFSENHGTKPHGGLKLLRELESKDSGELLAKLKSLLYGRLAFVFDDETEFDDVFEKVTKTLTCARKQWASSSDVRYRLGEKEKEKAKAIGEKAMATAKADTEKQLDSIVKTPSWDWMDALGYLYAGACPLEGSANGFEKFEGSDGIKNFVIYRSYREVVSTRLLTMVARDYLESISELLHRSVLAGAED